MRAAARLAAAKATLTVSVRYDIGLRVIPMAGAPDELSDPAAGQLHMRAVTLEPRKTHTLGLADIVEPPASDGPILVQSVALGVCGTDRELIEGHYGEAPPGHARLVIGHESLGRVIEAPENSGFRSGELVVGIVRHPDPVPCANCAVGEWDMCRNGR